MGNDSVLVAADWLSINGVPARGIEFELNELVNQRIAAGKFSRDDAQYIRKMHLHLTTGTLALTGAQLDKLRRACQLWDVDIRPREITSHRRLIGPVIIACKRLLYPVLRVFLKDFVRQQRSFNAAVIAVLADSLSKSNDSEANSAEANRSKH